MVNRKIICRLCLKKCGEHFKFIEENAKELLGILLLKIDLAISKTPVICKNCAETLKKCFDFKSACLYLQGYIVTLINTNDDTKQNLKIVYVGKKSNTDILENENVCQFCAGMLQSSCLDNEERYVKEMMLEKCLPEVELNVINISAICTGCHGAVQDYFTFITNCSTVEEKIKKYSEAVGKSCINLNNVLQYISENMCEEVDNKDDIIKIENNSTTSEDGDKIETTKIEIVCEEADNVNKEVDDFVELEDRKSKIENVCEEAENVHKEVDDFVELEDKKSNDMLQCTSENTVMCEDVKVVKTEESFGEEKLDDISHENENFMKMEDQKFVSCINEEIEIKTEPEDFDSSQDGVVLPQLGVTVKLQGNSLMLQNRGNLPKAYLDTQISAPKNPSRIKMFQCKFCSYQTKYKTVLNVHQQAHKEPTETRIYRCSICPFQTKSRSSLGPHRLIHKNPSEVTMLKCDICSFQTKYKNSLIQHMLTHKNPSEVQMYTCETCSFQTKYKYVLLRHSADHEKVIHKCEFCSFETKYIINFKKHVNMHEVADKKLFPCEICSFLTKYKSNLRKHFKWVHEDRSKITMYRCDSCSFQTKDKSDFNKHKLIHKDPSEVTIYKCEFCSLQTKYKSQLKRHKAIVHGTSEVAMYQCTICSFKTKYKQHLQNHIFRHDKITTCKYYV